MKMKHSSEVAAHVSVAAAHASLCGLSLLRHVVRNVCDTGSVVPADSIHTVSPLWPRGKLRYFGTRASVACMSVCVCE